MCRHLRPLPAINQCTCSSLQCSTSRPSTPYLWLSLCPRKGSIQREYSSCWEQIRKKVNSRKLSLKRPQTSEISNLRKSGMKIKNKWWTSQTMTINRQTPSLWSYWTYSTRRRAESTSRSRSTSTCWKLFGSNMCIFRTTRTSIQTTPSGTSKTSCPTSQS